MSSRPVRRSAIALALLLAVPSVALAAKPESGNYGAKNGTRFIVSNLTVKGGKASKFVAFTDCSPVPIPKALPTVPIKNGRFTFSTTARDVTGNELTIDVSGKAVSGRAIKVTMRYRNKAKGCDTGNKTYTAQLGLGSGSAF